MKTIVALQGASNIAIQAVLGHFVALWSARGLRIVGVVEVRNEAARRACEASRLRDIVTGLTYPIHQNLGPGSTSCQLDAAGVMSACEAVRSQILAGCDLVVLSKFGKLEAERSGLTAAFAAAVETDTPVMTAVSPMFSAQWQAFAGSLADVLPAQAAALNDWWLGLNWRCVKRAS